MIFNPKFRISNAIALALTAIERARGFLEAAQLSKEWVAKMQERALILEAPHTTHIDALSTQHVVILSDFVGGS
jgi:hypothetical protein